DLEDAVAPEQRPAAREHVAEWLKAGNSAVVRVNAAGTPWHDNDVAAVGDVAMALMVPKAERAEDLPRGTVIPLVETAAGIDNARAVCSAPGVVRPAFGSVDLAAELGVDPASYYALLHARSALVLAAAAADRTGPRGAAADGVRAGLGPPSGGRRRRRGERGGRSDGRPAGGAARRAAAQPGRDVAVAESSRSHGTGFRSEASAVQ